jgi:O-antigen/teichoic acid export membrane protein
MSKLRGIADRSTVLAMVDQALVSGASFLATILIGRFGHAESLGLYSLGMSVVLALLAVQMSLVTTPYAVQHHTAGPTARAYAGSTLVMQLGLLLAVCAGLMVTAMFVHGPAQIVLFATVPAAPLLLLREFARRMAYARLAIERSLAIDLPVVVLQTTGLIFLAARGALSAPAAFAVLGLSAAAGAIVGLTWLARDVRFDRGALPGDLQRHWNFGRWIAGGQLLAVVNTQGIFWLVSLLRGDAETGVYAACLAIVLLCNPFILAVGNILTPRAAQTLAHHGPDALRCFILRAAAIIAVVMTIFCAAVALCGDRLIQLLYGAEYAGHGLVITLLALTFLVSAVAMAVNDGLRALGRTHVEFAAMAVDALITVGIGFLALRWFGLTGLAAASLLGSIAALVLQAWVFLRRSAMS